MAFKEVTPRNTCEAVRRDYIMDTDADLAQIPTSCATGSRAFAVDSGTQYMLNASGEWAQVGFAIIKQPEDAIVTVGETVKFSIKAVGTALYYQWMYSVNGGVGWNNSTGADAKTDTLSIQATQARNGFQYKCKVTNHAGISIFSNKAQLYITEATTIPELYE